MKTRHLIILLALLIQPTIALGGDWPMDRLDVRRSGATDESLDAPRLQETWRWDAAQPPAPAWPSPARWDAYAGLAGMKSMRNYDPIHPPVMVGDGVFVSSNSDDTLRRFDLTTGERQWMFTANGPIRIAPTVSDGRVHFGCDDGRAYCLDAASGEPIWIFDAAPDSGTFINNGRAISLWPIRTGVLVEDGIAYFGCGMFPWQASYLHAVDAKTGEPVYARNLGNGLTLEGGMLASTEHILVPQGRIAPRLFKRSDGAGAGGLKGGGGSFVLLLDDGTALHGPGNKKASITESRAGAEEAIASFDGGNAVVVHQGMAYLLTDRALTAINRRTGALAWSTPIQTNLSLILADDTLFAGGMDMVQAIDAEHGKITWRAPVNGRAYGLAAANGTLLVTTDNGSMHAFSEGDTAAPPPYIEPPTRRFDTEYLAAAPSPGVLTINDPNLLDRWIFQADRMELIQLDPNDPRLTLQIRNLVPEGRPAVVAGRGKLIETDASNANAEEALRLDGGNADACVAESFLDDDLPTRAFTAEAWVRIDEPTNWGGILSVSQDNGTYEKGFIMGYRGDRFAVALNGTGGPDKLTWVTSPSPFTMGGWNHVATTYDGEMVRLYVNGTLTTKNGEQSGDIQYPANAFYQLGAYRDDDEYFRLNGALNEIRLYNTALSPETIAAHAAEKAGRFPPPPKTRPKEDTVEIARGPIVEVLSPGSARVRWWSNEPLPSHLDLEEAGETIRTIRPDGAPTTTHDLIIDGLRRNHLYTFRVHDLDGGTSKRSRAFELDTHFDFSGLTRDLTHLQTGTIDPRLLSNRTEDEPGIAIVFGAGELARNIALTTPLSVLVIDDDSDRIDRYRRRWVEEGIHGRGLSILDADPTATNLPGRIGDLVTIDETVVTPDSLVIAEAARLVQPEGRFAVSTAVPASDLPGRFLTPGRIEGDMMFARGTPIAGSAPWTHMYGTPDNSAYAGEELAGSEQIGDLEMQWAGRPGPRYQSDRGNRKPSPLAADGRLFMQGLNRVIAVDAYNGMILWELGLPELQRFNVPRDCSNWCTDGEEVFLATGDRCTVVDAPTGRINRTFTAPEASRGFDWGFIARQGDLLLGSSVASDAPFKDYWGSEHWYDTHSGPLAAKVCSENIFATDHASGEQRWIRSEGLVVNPTITITPDRVFFLECRDPQLRAADARRLDGDAFWNNLHLVALDIETGQVIWERHAKPLPGISIVSLVAAEGKLVLQTSNNGVFAVYVFNADTGEMEWRSNYQWETDHHGKHLSRPLVVKGRMYLRPLTIDLKNGDVLAESFPDGHQCGTYTASSEALFLRAGELAMWDRDSATATRLTRARPDCWISTIPAEGMLLSPEGGGGCSCGSWLETSMGLMPRRSGGKDPQP